MPYKDKEKRREYNRAYHTLHREKQLERRRNWGILHREEERESCRIYRLSHKEESKERGRKWCASHKKEGLCVHCSRKAIPRFTRCVFHSYIEKLYHQKYYVEHRQLVIAKSKERQNKMREDGKCLKCGAPKMMGEEGIHCVNCSMKDHHPELRGRGNLYEITYR